MAELTACVLELVEGGAVAAWLDGEFSVVGPGSPVVESRGFV